MLNVITFLLELIDKYTLWVYVACGLIIIYNIRNYVLARRDRGNTIFPVEREVAAHKEGRAMGAIGAVLAVAVLATAVKYYLVPAIDVEELMPPTPTLAPLIPTREPTPTEVVVEEPTATPRPSPTRKPVVLSTPTPPPPTLPPAPACPDPNTCISSPRAGETVSGAIGIRGTAQHSQFQFFKVEFGIGPDPSSWSSIGDIVRRPVANGDLAAFDTRSVPNGSYTIRLVVVDATGNFPPPFRVTVKVAN